MKLIFCPHCGDIVALRKGMRRSCQCGWSGGAYIDDVNAEIRGSAIPIGFDNDSFAHAVSATISDGESTRFVAFAIEDDCDSISRIKEMAMCYNCKHCFPTSGVGDFIGDEPGVIGDGTTCWYECRKGHKITDGKACREWEAEDDE